MKKMCLIVLALIALSIFTIGPSWAGSVDKLIDKLVEKKILTKSEATELITEMQAEEAKEAKEKKEVAAASTAKTISIPDWVANTKLTGDIRARYQTDDSVNDTHGDRNRGRIRARLGVETDINEHWKAGFGLATGTTSDPRSTDQDFADDSSHKNIYLDYAYAQYTPVKWASLSLGKFKNPIWNPEQMLWDSDINPEGFAGKFKFEPVKNIELFANIGAFMLEEVSTKANDPYVLTIQPGVNMKLPGDMYFKVAGSYYNFNNVKGYDWYNNGVGARRTNSYTTTITPAVGAPSYTPQKTNYFWKYDYDSFAGDAEFGITKIPGPIPYAAAYGQYVHSTDAHENNDGWLAGLKFGKKDIKDFGDWQVSYNYRRLEKDAWPDFLPESTAYNGNTNIKGHKGLVGFGIYKNVYLSLTYFNFEHIQKTADDTQTVVQADLNVKF